MSYPLGSEEEMVRRLQEDDAWRLTPATCAIKVTNSRWIPAPHLLYTSARIAAHVYAGNGRIVVEMPPRHGKSKLCSVHSPVWFLDHWPEKFVMITSYGADLATDHAREVRDIVADRQDLLRVKLRRDAKQVTRFLSNMGGGLRAAGVRGPITGRGFDLGIIDDYLKDEEQAESKTIRDKTWNWFTVTFMSRQEPRSTVIIIATRWNIDDVQGRLRDIDGGRDWEYIKFPAVAEEADVLGREAGQALWPERYSIEDFDRLRAGMTNYFWQAVYQQNPIRAHGLHGGEFIVVEDLPFYKRLRFVRYWDLAASEAAGDWTVGALLAEDTLTGLVYLVDLVRGQWSPWQLEQKIAEVGDRDGKEIPVGLEQEPGAGGKISADHLARNVLKGHAVTIHPAVKAKFLRAQGILACIERGHLHLLKAPWNQDVKDEFRTFPDGKHDDIVDSTAGAYNKMFEKRLMGGTWGRRVVANDVIQTRVAGEVQSMSKNHAVWGRGHNSLAVPRRYAS